MLARNHRLGRGQRRVEVVVNVTSIAKGKLVRLAIVDVLFVVCRAGCHLVHLRWHRRT